MEKGPAADVQLVVFRLGQEEYAVSILQVQEIKRLAEITRVPKTPAYIKGVINLRGSVLPVIDLKSRIGLAAGEKSDDARIVITRLEDVSVGLIVDSVSEVLTLNSADIEPPAGIAAGAGAQFIAGVGKVEGRLVILLDLETLIAPGTGQ